MVCCCATPRMPGIKFCLSPATPRMPGIKFCENKMLSSCHVVMLSQCLMMFTGDIALRCENKTNSHVWQYMQWQYIEPSLQINGGTYATN